MDIVFTTGNTALSGSDAPPRVFDVKSRARIEGISACLDEMLSVGLGIWMAGTACHSSAYIREPARGGRKADTTEASSTATSVRRGRKPGAVSKE